MVRVFRNEDLAVIMDIGDRAWVPIYAMYRNVYGDELFSTITPEPSSVKGEQIRSFCDKHPERMLVCERNGRIVGFISLIYTDGARIGEIGNNAVDPAAGEKGVGQEMYQAAFEWFRTKGCTYVKVSTGCDEAHAPARRAYERAGFDTHTEAITYFRKL